MGRKKKSTLENWEQVDESLRRLGEIERVVSSAENRLNKRIETMKAETKEKAAPLLEEKKSLEKDIERYCRENQADLGDRRSRDFTHGTIRFRKVSKVVMHSVKNTVASIKKIFPQRKDQLLIVKESPNKDALGRLEPDELSSIGCTVRESDEFGYDIDWEKIGD